MRIPANNTKANNSPGETVPSITWRPPYHKTAAAEENVSRLMTGMITAMIPARRMVSESVVSTCCAKRASSRWVLTKDLTRSEEHTSELQSQSNLVCRLLLEKKKKKKKKKR